MVGVAASRGPGNAILHKIPVLAKHKYAVHKAQARNLALRALVCPLEMQNRCRPARKKVFLRADAHTEFRDPGKCRPVSIFENDADRLDP